MKKKPDAVKALAEALKSLRSQKDPCEILGIDPKDYGFETCDELMKHWQKLTKDLISKSKRAK